MLSRFSTRLYDLRALQSYKSRSRKLKRVVTVWCSIFSRKYCIKSTIPIDYLFHERRNIGGVESVRAEVELEIDCAAGYHGQDVRGISQGQI